MKFIAALSFLSTAAAFGAFGAKKASPAAAKAFDVQDLPGILAPAGFFDPLGLSDKADEATMKRYREAELTHGRVAMLAVVGFFVGEAVEGSSFLFDASIKGPAITHLTQVPFFFWLSFTVAIAGAETRRAEAGFVSPAETPVTQAGLMRLDYTSGDLGFDPLGLKPEDPEEFKEMATKELQHGRVAMLAAAGFLAQEATDGQGIVEHLAGYLN